MALVPIRCRIPDRLEQIGKDRLWLQKKTNMSKQQLSDYINMRYVLGLTKAKNISILLKLKSSDDLYDWEWREE